MKKQNLIRNLLIIALLVGGIFSVGAGGNVHAQDGGYLGSGGGRSGYIIGGGRADAGTNSTGADSTSGGLLGSGGGRTENTTLIQQSNDEEESKSFLDSIMKLFF